MEFVLFAVVFFSSGLHARIQRERERETERERERERESEIYIYIYINTCLHVCVYKKPK